MDFNVFKQLKKRTFVLIITLCAVTLTSCGDNDVQPTNAFTLNGFALPTDNAYLFLDDGPFYEDAFFFILADATFQEQPGGEVLAETSMDNAVGLYVQNSNGTVNSEEAVDIPIGKRLLSGESKVYFDINKWALPIPSNGFGTIIGAELVLSIDKGMTGTVTINSVNIDYVARTGTVNLDYSITGSEGELVTGHYEGSFEIINEF